MKRSLCLVMPALVFAATSCQTAPPSPEQLRAEFLTWKFGMFLHFNVATFNDREWANGYEDPATFAPANLDFGQWADAARTAGMNYAVLTVKHTGAWSLWDSEHTTHDATALMNYKSGKGDLVREYVEAFRARDIKIGLYYCFPGNYTGRWGNTLPEGEHDLHGLPLEAQDDYVGFIKKQLTELLTRYGEIDLLWIDQWGNEYTGSEWREILAFIKSLQPGCVVIANNARDYEDTDIFGWEYPWTIRAQPEEPLPPEGNTNPAEVSDTIGPSWFWNTAQDQTAMKSAEEIVAMLRLSNERRANYLLNVAPDTTGLLPEPAVQRLREVGQLLAIPNG